MMDIESLWERALKETEIHRMRLQDLATFEATVVPYIFLAESALHQGDTVVRKGRVLIERPSIVLPRFLPQFEGFDFPQTLHVTEEAVSTLLLVRGVQFPSLRYHHEVSSLDVLEQPLQKAINAHTDQLRRAEDITTGLVLGPEAAWQFSVLILVGALVIRSAQGDLRRIIEAWQRRQRDSSSPQ